MNAGTESRDAARLLADFVAGSDAAFTALVETEGARLYGFIRRYLRDHAEADDVYQAVWIKVARSAAGFDGASRFSTWLYAIARNACLDSLRGAARRRQAPLPEAAEAAPERATGMELQELGEKIRAAVSGLPEEQREVFLLKEDAGLSFEEIGKLLGCGKDTAKSRMRYALEKLRGALGREARLYGVAEG